MTTPTSWQPTSDTTALRRRSARPTDIRGLPGYWPKQTDDRTGITAYLNSVQKYVLSSTLTEPDWENTTIVRGELVEEVEALKAEPGNDIVCAGSVSVAQALVGYRPG
jgi:dihydrofolate reductase